MLKGYLERLLLEIFGEYVEGLNKDALHLSVWQGDILLSNVRLKKAVLNSLNVPVDIIEGNILKLHIKGMIANIDICIPCMIQIQFHLFVIPYGLN